MPKFFGGGGTPTPDLVTSVFGRIGAVVAVLGDYAASLISNNSNVPGATVQDALNYFAQAPAAVAGGAAPALDFAVNRYQVLTLNQNASPTMTIPPAGVEVILEVVQPAAGGPFTLTYPATVDWTLGVEPSLSVTANARDVLRFLSNGTRLRGWAMAMEISP